MLRGASSPPAILTVAFWARTCNLPPDIRLTSDTDFAATPAWKHVPGAEPLTTLTGTSRSNGMDSACPLKSKTGSAGSNVELQACSAMLDGEIVCPDHQGKP